MITQLSPAAYAAATALGLTLLTIIILTAYFIGRHREVSG